jgi:DNA-binding response OmpR family regulator
MGYRLEANGAAVVYSTDHEPYSQEVALGAAEPLRGEDEAHRDFVQGADLLIHDAQYTAAEYRGKVGWGHSTVEYAADLAMAAQVGHVVLYHHDPTRTDDAVDGLVDIARRRIAETKGSVRASGATEGEIIEIEGGRNAGSARRRSGPSGLSNPADVLANEAVLIAVAGGKERAILAEAATADAIPTLLADDAAELLAAVDGRWPSLIFIGDDLPRADPLELCGRIRGLPHPRAATTPVVVVTDEPLVDLTAGEAASVTAWLTRPFSTQYARSRIRGWLLRTMCRWTKAPLPADEATRIEALYRLNLLDTEAEERFDRHTRIAAAALEAPIALVSLVDRERQWFKSRHGLDTRETPRDMAFCAHAILGDDAFVVTDALQDERFADNPLVTDGPRARFYAGVPLRTAGGVRIGTLCVIDKRPRDLRSGQRKLLEDLARTVERELEQGIVAR